MSNKRKKIICSKCGYIRWGLINENCPKCGYIELNEFLYTLGQCIIKGNKNGD